MSKELRPIHPGADLIGMFLVLDTTDHEHYRIGHIAAAVGNCYLIQFDKLEEKDPLPPMELYTLDEQLNRAVAVRPPLARLTRIARKGLQDTEAIGSPRFLRASRERQSRRSSNERDEIPPPHCVPKAQERAFKGLN